MTVGYARSPARPPARPHPYPTPMPRLHRSSLPFAAALVVLGPAPLLRAQEPPAPAAPLVAADSAPNPLTGLSAASLRPGRWVYRSTMERGGQSVELARRTLSVAPAAGPSSGEAWLILDVTEAQGQQMVDSLLVRRSDLRPLARNAQMGPMRLEAHFGEDSVRGSLSAPQAGSVPIAVAMGPGLVANMGMLESALTLIPLHAGWTGTVRQLVPGPAGMMVAPITLAVTGEDTVTVPAGTYPAWALSASTGGTDQLLWVSKADGRLLRVRATPPQVSDLTYETVLVEQAGAAPPR